jgi:hypothetical protein
VRKTIGKMLDYPLPTGYSRQKPIRRPKLGPWQGVIDAILEDVKQRPKKQRHRAKRILERLRAEHGYFRHTFLVFHCLHAFTFLARDGPLHLAHLSPAELAISMPTRHAAALHRRRNRASYGTGYSYERYIAEPFPHRLLRRGPNRR